MSTVEEALAADGLRMPTISDDFADSLVRPDASTLTTDNIPMSGDGIYLHFPLVEFVEADPQPFVVVSLGGHGINSYAWTYAVSAYGVTVIGQVARGGAYADLDRTRREWEILLDGAVRVIEAAEVADLDASNHLIVEWNTLRDIAEWRWIDAEPEDAAMAGEFLHGDPDGAVFDDAIRDAIAVACRG